MNKTEQQVLKFIDQNKLISSGDRILIALSGGADSVFMLHLLEKFTKRFKIETAALHVNHQLRGNEADLDEQFCRELCIERKIPFFSVRADVKRLVREKKVSLEEAGRTLRYEQFYKCAAENGFNKIATAHNSSDNAETVLLNVIKGTGLKGIAGIPPKRDIVIRPILILTKDEILEYLNNSGIRFRFDESNRSDDFERNFLRNRIVPLIKERLNPSLEKKLLNSGEIFRNSAAYIDKASGELEADAVVLEPDRIVIDARKLKAAEPELAYHMIKSCTDRNFLVQTRFNDIAKVFSMTDKEAGTEEHLSGKLIAERGRGTIIISRRKYKTDFKPVPISAGGTAEINGRILSIEETAMPVTLISDKNTEYIAADGIDAEFIVRRWNAGDRFYPIGLKGTKKVSDFLNDQKVEPAQKDKSLLLTNQGKIVWVIGLRLDERFKITDNTRKVFKICLK